MHKNMKVMIRSRKNHYVHTFVGQCVCDNLHLVRLLAEANLLIIRFLVYEYIHFEKRYLHECVINIDLKEKWKAILLPRKIFNYKILKQNTI